MPIFTAAAMLERPVGMFLCGCLMQWNSYRLSRSPWLFYTVGSVLGGFALALLVLHRLWRWSKPLAALVVPLLFSTTTASLYLSHTLLACIAALLVCVNMAALYWVGHPTAERTLNVIRAAWHLAGAALVVAAGGYPTGVAAELGVALLSVVFYICPAPRMWIRRPQLRSFISEQEFERVGEHCTRKGLEDMLAHLNQMDNAKRASLIRKLRGRDRMWAFLARENESSSDDDEIANKKK